MTVCKFFLEGRCKFGDNCKFEHSSRGGQNQGVQRQLFGGGGGGQRVEFRDSFGSSQSNSGNQYKWTANNNQRQQSQHASGQSTIDLVNSLQKEIETCEKSKQWPFSCVSIDKDLPCLPDFDDWSPEELRFEAYTAMKSGDTQSYVTKVQQMTVDYSNKRQQLKNINPSMKQKLIEFIDDYKNKKGTDLRRSSFGGGSSAIGSTSGSSGAGFGAGSMFGGSSGGSAGGSSSGSSGGSFGQTAATSSIFGGGSSSSKTAFGKPAGGLFGQSSTGSFGVGSGTTAFGGGSSTSGFSTESSTSTFGGQSPSHTFGTSTFGASSSPSAAAPTSPTSTFGSGSSSAFGSGTNSVFGGTATFGGMSATGGGGSGGTGFGSGSTAGGTVFGGNASQGTFGSAGNTGFTPTTQSTGFGGGTGSVFGGSSAFSPSSASSAFGAPSAPPATSAFGTTSNASSQSSVPPSGFFGGATPTSAVAPSVVPIVTAANSRMYTPMEELTEEEKAQFSAPSFVLGKIPTKPPPRELING